MKSYIHYLGRRSKFFLLAGGIVLVAVLGLIDYFSGSEISFSIFYFLPIYLAARYLGRWYGVAISIISAATWLTADLLSGAHYSHPIIPLWNAVMRLGVFLVVTHYTSALDELNEGLERKVEERTEALTAEIRERQAIEDALNEHQAFLRKVIDLNPGHIFAKDREGRFRLANRPVAEIYGTTVENLVGKTDAEFNPNADEVEFFRRTDLEVMDSQQMKFIPEEKLTDSTGRVHWLEATKIPIIDESGRANQVLGVATDITERRRAERLQESVYRIAEAAGSSATLNDLFREVHKIISNVMPANNFYIALYDEKTGLMSFPYFVDELDVAPLPRVPGKGLTDYVLRTGKSLLCDEAIDAELQSRREVELVGVPSAIWLGVPLTIGQKTIGAMVVQHYSERTAYGEREKQVLEFVSSEVARAIDRKWAGDKLRESEERYRRLIEMSPDAIAVHSDGNIVYVNSAAIKLMGAKNSEELVGKPLKDVVHPGDWDVVTQRIRKMVAEGEDVPLLEEKFVRLDGKIIDVEVSAIPFTFQGKPAVQTVVRDITERKRVQEALELQRSYFQQLFESSPAGIVLLDKNNAILNANKAFERMFQYAVEEIRGKNIDEIVVPDSLMEEGRDLSAKSQHGQLVEKETVRKRKDGTFINVNITGYPIVIEGERAGIYGMYVDVTERKKLEGEFRQAQKMEGIGTLAGGIAHDFNNVLGIILAYTSVLQQGKLDPARQAQSLETIGKAVQRGASLVKQLLTFARKTDVLLESVKLNDLLVELHDLLNETFPKTIILSLRLDQKLPSIVADHNQLHQALLNLCLNARDAMPRGGVITFSTRIQRGASLRERYQDAQDEQYVHVSINDTGEGMDDTTQERIFEPFFTTKGRGKGTGLGLAVVYGVVKSHRGYIDVESRLGNGTTFSLFFPVPVQRYESFQAHEEESKDVVGGNETILIVEDEEVLLDLLRNIAEMKGYTAIVARDGEEAVRVYRERKDDIALVLTDLGLPKLGGFEEFLEIKRINKRAKVIFASGYFDPQLRIEMSKSGVNDFVLKPYEPNTILRKIRELLDAK